MKISNAVSVAIDGVSAKTISPSEAKKNIAKAIYEVLLENKTIAELSTHDQVMVSDVSELLGMKVTFYSGGVIGLMRKDDVNGKVF